MHLTLRQASRQVMASKSTILRAIQSGRMSAHRQDDGSWRIDPAELFRCFDPVPAGGSANPVEPGGPESAVGQSGPGGGPSMDRVGSDGSGA
jgi:excisionase family DNA binding protein